MKIVRVAMLSGVVALTGCYNYFPGGVFTCRTNVPRVEEDQVPWFHGASPLVDYEGGGSGCAIYKDGAIYDSTGWNNVMPRGPR